MNKASKCFMTFCISILVTMQSGCKGGFESEENSNEESSHIGLIYDEEIYQLENYSVASLESSDTQYLDPPVKLNSWLISTIGSSRTEIALKLRTKNPGVSFDDPSVWALFFRTSPNPVGIKYFDEMGVNLFYKYSENSDLCCKNTLPFEDFDLAEQSYVAVGGYVEFESSNKGYFSLDFQQETNVHSEVFEGQIVNVRGCWNIAGESGVSGCSL